jgi:hypothetical protein
MYQHARAVITVSLFDGRAGETVVVETKKSTGEDSHGNATYTLKEIAVDYVLVSPGARGDVQDSIRPDGVVVAYTLHFPKTCTLNLRGCRVKVGGDWYKVIGSPKHYDHALTPGAWSMPVEVEAVDG